jgi:hypothetical protein
MALNRMRIARNAVRFLLGTPGLAALAGSVDAACFAPPSGMISWWPGQGNANDFISTNNGVLQGGATASATGEVGTAFSMDGTSGYVQIPDASAFHLANLTIEAWVKFTSLTSVGSGGSPAGQQYIIFKQNSQANNFEGFALTKERNKSSDNFQFEVTAASGTTAAAVSGTAVATNVWYHVAGVRGSNYLQLYVNGVLQQQVSVAFAQDYGTLPLFFGTSGESVWDHKFSGLLDEVALYNRALASNEIAGIYAAGAAGKCINPAVPSVVAQPQGLSAPVGSNASFAVTALGTAPLGYQWDFQGAAITNATNGSFALTNLQVTNAGNYTVVITNSVGSATSVVAALNVLAPPAFVSQPLGSAAAPGATATFAAGVTGSTPMSFQWQANGTNLSDGGRISGSADTNLVIANVQPADVGNYVLVASNSLGATTSAVASLTVTGPPAIIIQPASQSAALGAGVSFNVLASGTPPLACQWQKNGANLTDDGTLSGSATSTLTLSAVAASDPGFYRVIVTNGQGSVTSSIALLNLAGNSTSNVTGADTLVLVNSQSAKYLDFQHYLQPYLDTFGLAYTVLDIASNTVDTNVGHYALIIIGHAQLDTNHLYLDTVEQGNISTAVSNGTGLVNMDNVLAAGSSNNYAYEQNIFGFTYGASNTGLNVTLPPTEAGSQMHYISSLHPTNDTLILSNTMYMAGLILPTNATAVAQSGGKPFLVVRKVGQGRAVQYASYDWIAVAVMGQVNGLDDLLWRSFVWAARKPFVMRGMPNFATMRVDDAAGPFTWVHTLNQVGFKPYIALFINSIAAADASDLSGLANGGGCTCSIHSFTDANFFYFDHNNGVPFSDSVISNNFTLGTQWHVSHNVPISKMMIPHWSEIGPNAFAGLKAWGIQYVLIEMVPGTLEYEDGEQAPWLPIGPYRLYETPRLGESLNPLFYADWLPVPGHPEFNGQFFDPYTEIRNVRQGVTVLDGGDWDPDTSVAATISRATLQIKRGLDSLTLGNVFTHEKYIDAIPNSTWLQILQGITNNLASYNPAYVTMDYAEQYLRAKKTSHLTGANYDTGSGQVTVTLTGYADLTTLYYVYTGADSAITNYAATIPIFSGLATNTAQISNIAPTIQIQPQDLTVAAGNPAVFTVAVDGTAPLYYSWQCNGTNLPGATNSFLLLPAAQPEDAEAYSVIVSNATGQVLSSNATLTVLGSPVITTQPASQTVNAGSDITLNVAASGAAPLNYFWEKDNLPISGATGSNYFIAQSQPADNGNYTVVVTNAGGSVTSTVAVITVMPPPAPVLHATVVSNMLVLSFAANPGQSYVVEYANTPDATGWSTLTNITATDTNVVCHDSINGPVQRYYRVQAIILGAAGRLPGSAEAAQYVLFFNARTRAISTLKYRERAALPPWSHALTFADAASVSHPENRLYPTGPP